MFFQKLLPIERPYAAKLISNSAEQFPIHRHYEFEVIYCARGALDFALDGKDLHLESDEVAIIPSMSAHGVISVSADSLALFVDIGPAFLKSGFSTLTSLAFSHNVISLSKEETAVERLKSSLNGIMSILNSKMKSANDFEMIGNIYLLCASLVELGEGSRHVQKSTLPLVIENVLEHIHTNYSTNITLDDAARISGYSKGNFCKIFKEITGYGFHSYLNNYRIQTSLYMLEETDMPIGDIAELVGFPEAKTFCRVFKENTSKTPSEYRNSSQKSAKTHS